MSHETLLNEILNTEDLSSFQNTINQLHPADAADLLESLPEAKRLEVWSLVSSDLKGEILLEVHGEAAQQLINATPENDLIDALKNLQIDEIIDLESALPKTVIDAVASAMGREKRQNYLRARKYPEDSAGGLMDVDALSVFSSLSLSDVRHELQNHRVAYGDMPEHLNSISVVDEGDRYLGELSLINLVSLPQSAIVKDVMDTDQAPIRASMNAKGVAKIFEDRDLLSAPVVDEKNHLVGRITIDDVVDYIRSESEHMILTPVGLSAETDLFSSIVASIKNRSFWLGLNLINAFLAALVISIFSPSIEKIVLLAVLMPVIASMSGVIGNQTLTLVTRGLALSQITNENLKLLLVKEASVGLINGIIWATFVGVISYLWFGQLGVSLVFGAAMLLSIFFSAMSGTLIPILLQKLSFDPAIAGSVLIVAISDILGFFIFLGIATFFLL